jgi:hypothetical protein
MMVRKHNNNNHSVTIIVMGNLRMKKTQRMELVPEE